MVDIQKDMITYSGRYYTNRWSQLHLHFDSSADVIIDGARWILPNPNPEIVRVNKYEIPISLWIRDCEFNDEGFIFDSTMLDGRQGYGTLFFDGGNITLGSKSYGGVIITDPRTTTDNEGSSGLKFYPWANSVYDFDGLRISGSKGFKGVAIRPSTSASNSIVFTMDDTSIYGIADISYSASSGGTFNVTNTLVGSSRYPLWGGGHDYINFDNYIYNNYYIWSDSGTIRGLTPRTTENQITYHRSYMQYSNDNQ